MAGTNGLTYIAAQNGDDPTGTFKLGGSLTEATIIAAGNNKFTISAKNAALNSYIVIEDDIMGLQAWNTIGNQGTVAKLEQDVITIGSYDTDNITGSFLDGDNVSFTISFDNGVTFNDGRGTTTGIEYAADYSADYTARSLTDKAYVDDAIDTYVRGVDTLQDVRDIQSFADDTAASSGGIAVGQLYYNSSIPAYVVRQA
jgi:hypothetical protein